MGKYKKLLVAFDGSESSKNALRQAIRLAETEKSWIKVVAVVPSYEGDLELVGVRNIKEVLKGPAEKLLADAIGIAKAERAAIMTNLEQGEAYEKIVEVANDENCDVIVIGKSGSHNIETALIGSVTARVIGLSNKDVLVVPQNAEIGWKNILFGTDGSKNSEMAQRHALDFVHSYGGSLHVLSVVDVPDELYGEAPDLVDSLIEKARSYVTIVQNRAAELGIETHTYVREGNSHELLVRFANKFNADLIVMGSHGRTGLKRLLMGSVTEKVIGTAPCPVLVVKS